jgi:hypothetical protein
LSTVEWPGYAALQKRLSKLGTLTITETRPLLEEFERIIIEDNRKGVLSSLDKDGAPMVAVKYRNGVYKNVRARRGQKFGSTLGTYKGIGFGMQGGSHLNGNLTTKEYKQLTGPPLAPRGEQSRVIANLKTGHGQDGNSFYAVGSWKQVVSVKGKSFLPAHFNGSGHLPVRDLRGVRPWGMREAQKAVRAWAKYLLKK